MLKAVELTLLCSPGASPAILGKLGVAGMNSNLATLIRTVVIFGHRQTERRVCHRIGCCRTRRTVHMAVAPGWRSDCRRRPGHCIECLAWASYIEKSPKLTVHVHASMHIGVYTSTTQEKAMKYQIALASVFAALVAISAPVSAKGALKGAAVGAAVGHVAGHHAVAGAAVGAAVGRHRANKANR